MIGGNLEGTARIHVTLRQRSQLYHVCWNLRGWIRTIQGALRQNQAKANLQALVQDTQEWLPPPFPAVAPEAPLRGAVARVDMAGNVWG